MVSDRYCDEIIEELETHGKWSKGAQMVRKFTHAAIVDESNESQALNHICIDILEADSITRARKTLILAAEQRSSCFTALLSEVTYI
jgi:hypothetical protein